MRMCRPGWCPSFVLIFLLTCFVMQVTPRRKVVNYEPNYTRSGRASHMKRFEELMSSSTLAPNVTLKWDDADIRPLVMNPHVHLRRSKPPESSTTSMSSTTTSTTTTSSTAAPSTERSSPSSSLPTTSTIKPSTPSTKSPTTTTTKSPSSSSPTTTKPSSSSSKPPTTTTTEFWRTTTEPVPSQRTTEAGSGHCWEGNPCNKTLLLNCVLATGQKFGICTCLKGLVQQRPTSPCQADINQLCGADFLKSLGLTTEITEEDGFPEPECLQGVCREIDEKLYCAGNIGYPRESDGDEMDFGLIVPPHLLEKAKAIGHVKSSSSSVTLSSSQKMFERVVVTVIAVTLILSTRRRMS